METKKYELIELSHDKILVISQTWERPEVYWDDLIQDLKPLQKVDAEMYFDFLLKNGPRDRFYKAQLKDGQVLFASFKRISLEESLIKISNEFFAKHWSLVENSLLTKIQKFAFRRQISSSLEYV